MKIPCPQCGGEVPVRDAVGFVRCPFCGSSLVLDLGGVRPHLLYHPRRAAADVLPLLRDWCDREGLPLPSSLSSPQLVYRPFWRFYHASQSRLVPAWPTIESRWGAVLMPEGEQVVFDPALIRSGAVAEPAVAEAAARKGDDPPGDLVHVPFYDLQGTLGGSRLWFSVDACSGRVLPERLPPLSRRVPGHAAILTAAIVGFLLMFLESAFIPHGGLAAVAVAGTSGFVYWVMMGERGVPQLD